MNDPTYKLPPEAPVVLPNLHTLLLFYKALPWTGNYEPSWVNVLRMLAWRRRVGAGIQYLHLIQRSTYHDEEETEYDEGWEDDLRVFDYLREVVSSVNVEDNV